MNECSARYVIGEPRKNPATTNVKPCWSSPDESSTVLIVESVEVSEMGTKRQKIFSKYMKYGNL